MIGRDQTHESIRVLTLVVVPPVSRPVTSELSLQAVDQALTALLDDVAASVLHRLVIAPLFIFAHHLSNY